MKINWHVHNGLEGCTIRRTLELDSDDYTDNEIDQLVEEEMWNHIEWGWSKDSEQEPK